MSSGSKGAPQASAKSAGRTVVTKRNPSKMTAQKVLEDRELRNTRAKANLMLHEQSKAEMDMEQEGFDEPGAAMRLLKGAATEDGAKMEEKEEEYGAWVSSKDPHGLEEAEDTVSADGDEPHEDADHPDGDDDQEPLDDAEVAEDAEEVQDEEEAPGDENEWQDKGSKGKQTGGKGKWRPNKPWWAKQGWSGQKGRGRGRKGQGKGVFDNWGGEYCHGGYRACNGDFFPRLGFISRLWLIKFDLS